MSPDNPQSPRQELEARLTALLLDELPDAEAASLREFIAHDTGLSRLHDRLKQTIELVRETATSPIEQSAAQPTPLRLSDERRQKLLAHFKTAVPKEFVQPRKRNLSWIVPVGAAAAILILSAITIPNFTKARESSRLNSIVNNLRMLEGAKDQWALENRKGRGDAPTLADLSDYLKGGTVRQITGENYVIGRVGEPATADFDAAEARKQFGRQLPRPERGQRARFSADAEWSLAARSEGTPSTSQNGRAHTITTSGETTAPRMEEQLVATRPLVRAKGGPSSTEASKGRPSGQPATPADARPPGAEVAQTAARRREIILPSAGKPTGAAAEQLEARTYGARAPEIEQALESAASVLPGNLAAAGPQGAGGLARGGSGGGGGLGGVEDKSGIGFQGGSPPSSGARTGNVPALGDTPALGMQLQTEITRAGVPPDANRLAVERYGLISRGATEPANGDPAAAAPVESGPAPTIIPPAAGKDPSKLGAVDSSNVVVADNIAASPEAPLAQRTLRKQALDPSPNGRTNPLADDKLAARAFVQEGRDSYEKGRLVEAETKLSQAATIDPSNAAAFYYREPIDETKYADTQREGLVRNKEVSAGYAFSADLSSGERLRESVAQVPGYSLALPKSTDGGKPGSTTLDRLERELEQQDKQIKEARTRVDEWRTKLNISDIAPEGSVALDSPEKLEELTTRYRPYFEAKRELDNLLKIRDAAFLRTLQEKADAGLNEELAEQDKRIASVRLDLERLESKKKTEPVEEDRPLPPRKPDPNAPIPQPEIQTRDNSFSTFSLNVSDVSFKLAAASLEKGALPEPASIRSEEFINAFDYCDPEPPPGAPIAFAWERARYPFAHNRDLLRFSVKTAAAGRQPGRPLNLVLLLDNSGSMERADRVRIIHEALRILAAQLQPQDKLSVITFARTPRLWADGVAGNQAGEIAEEVGGITPQGGTNLEEAMHLAYQTALRHYSATGVNRVVLLTDGAANLGNVDPEALKLKVEAHRRQGIALDCFGVGWEGFNDDLLEVLSRNGDGRYGFLNSPEEAATEFAGQLAGALKVAASDVKVQVEFNPRRVTAYRQIGYAKHQLTREQFRDNTVDAAEIGAAESGNALYVAEVNPRGEGPLAIVRVRFKVPGAADYREHEWAVPFTGNAVALEQASPAMRLAATVSAFSEWLASSPYAAEVTPDRLLGYVGGVPEVYGADARPKKLEWMIRQAKAIAGK